MSTRIIEDEHNDYMRSFFMQSTSRTRLCYYAEFVFTLIILLCAFLEAFVYDAIPIGVVLLIGSYATLLLYFIMYFGCVYNCVALLSLHTYITILVGFTCWVGVLHPLLFESVMYNSVENNRELVYKYYSFLIIYGCLMGCWAASSYSRWKEIKSVEKSHLDHLIKLLMSIKKIAKDIPMEGRKYSLKPKDVYSLS